MRRVLLPALLAAAAACRGETGPNAGDLAVRLNAARPGDRAIVFVVTGHLHAVSAPAGGVSYRVFADTSADGDTARVVVVAPVGSGLPAGEIARIRVDDTRKAGSHTARIVDIATAQYAVGDTVGASLTVVRP